MDALAFLPWRGVSLDAPEHPREDDARQV